MQGGDGESRQRSLPDKGPASAQNLSSDGAIPTQHHNSPDGVRLRSQSSGEAELAGVSGQVAMDVRDDRVFVEAISSASNTSGPDATSIDGFDEAGYLRLNPDVREAVELGRIKSGLLHYRQYGYSEDRPLPGPPREPRNVMLTPLGEARRPDISAKEARCAVDAILIAPKAGMMVVGWIDDAAYPLTCIRVVGPDWRFVIDDSRYFRQRREDVEKAIGDRGSYHFGFIGFLHFDRGGEAAGPVIVELWREGGFWTALKCVPKMVEDVDLRNIALAHIGRASYFGNSLVESVACLGRGVGDELVEFNNLITRRLVAAPYIERFGPRPRSSRGSIIVCIYGRPEFFFLQNCLYAGLPGIEDYEFVYVCNSPELAEPLLHEARSASLLYGLATTIVILPGNAGFGAANNAAARVAGSGRLLAVNPDVFPRDREWARKHSELLVSAPARETRLFGTSLYYDNGSLMHGGMYFEVDVGLSMSSGRPTAWKICRTEHYGKGAPADAAQFVRPRAVPAVTGAFLSIDRHWFEQLGGFTEDFIFGHYEDADLCLKSLEKGTPAWLQDIRMWHLEGGGSTRLPPHEGGSLVNRWLFSRTWLPLIESELAGSAPSHKGLRSSYPANGDTGIKKSGQGRTAK